jgi:hypothetical protein
MRANKEILYTFRKWKKFNKKIFEQRLQCILFGYFLENTNFETVNAFYTFSIQNLIELYVPTTTKRVRKPEPEKWLTPEIMSTKRQRNKSRKSLISAKKIGIDYFFLEDEYKRLRNEVVAKIRETKKNFIYTKYEESLAEKQKFWKEINIILPTKRNIGTKCLTETELSADKLSEFFISEPLIIASSIEDKNGFNLNFIKSAITEEFSLPTVSVSFVEK